jgi:hypothetical protein
VPRQKVSAAEELVKYDDMITVAVSQGNALNPQPPTG